MDATDRYREAEQWFVRLQDTEAADLAASELLRWEQWAADPDNRRAFGDIKQLWQQLDALPSPAEPSARELAADDFDGSLSIERWQFARGARRTKRLALAIAAGFAAIAVGVTLHFARGPASSGDSVQSYETGPGEHRTLALPDGSSIVFGGRTALSTHYTENRRVIVLDRGEAWFSVARDRQRPFTVLAGTSAITAIGTQFNVRRDLDAVRDRTVVTVAEGIVDVGSHTTGAVDAPDRKPTRLGVGEALAYDNSGKPGEITHANLEATAAWKYGRLEYRQEPLKFVIPDVNRYSTKPIVLADAAAGELPFSGTVFQGQVEEWARALQSALAIEVTDTGERIVITSRPAREP